MSEPDVALALSQPWVSIDNDSQGTSPTGLLGQEHPHPRAYGTFPRILRKYVREEQAPDARGRDPQVHRAAGAAHAPGRPRRAQAGHVGRRRRLRSGTDRGQGDLRESEPAFGGDGVRAGQRRAGDRRWPTPRTPCRARSCAVPARPQQDPRNDHHQGWRGRSRGGAARDHATTTDVPHRRLHRRGLHDRHRRRRPARAGSRSRPVRGLRQREAAEDHDVRQRHPADHGRDDARSQRQHAPELRSRAQGGRGIRRARCCPPTRRASAASRIASRSIRASSRATRTSCRTSCGPSCRRKGRRRCGTPSASG